MPEKYLRVEMPDGSKWDVPARVIAEDRAYHYADRDAKEESGETSGPKYGTVFARIFAEEVKHALGDDYEIQDWAANNMNWSDVASVAMLAVPAPSDIDFEEGWVNGDKEIVEH